MNEPTFEKIMEELKKIGFDKADVDTIARVISEKGGIDD